MNVKEALEIVSTDMIWGIRNKELNLILPIPYRYYTKAEAARGREELITHGKDLSTQDDLAKILEVVPLTKDKKEGLNKCTL